MPKSGPRLRWAAKAELNRFVYKPANAREAAHKYTTQVQRKLIRIKYLQVKLAADGQDFHWQPQIDLEREACKRLLRGREYVLDTPGGIQ